MDLTYKDKKESYLHNAAKIVLAAWLKLEGKNVKIEHKFKKDDSVIFIPDVVVFENEIIKAIYEVVHKNEVDGFKLMKMQYYFYTMSIDFPACYEIQAEYILKQINKPEKLELIRIM